jgi:hypothetical protein
LSKADRASSPRRVISAAISPPVAAIPSRTSAPRVRDLEHDPVRRFRQIVPQAVRPLVDGCDDRVTDRRQLVVKARAAGDEARLERLGRALQRQTDLAALRHERADHLGPGLGELAGDVRRAFLKATRQDVAGPLEGKRHVLRLGLERVRDVGPDRRDLVLHRLGGLGQPVDQVVAALVEIGDTALARQAERPREVVAAPFERSGHALACGLNGLDDPVGGRRQFLGQSVMRARDRAPHAFRVADDRFALRHELVHERTNSHLVVRIGALQRGDLSAYDRLELAGPGEGAFEPVPDGRHFPADGTGHVHHRIGRILVGLGEADRHLADRTGDHFISCERTDSMAARRNSSTGATTRDARVAISRGESVCAKPCTSAPARHQTSAPTPPIHAKAATRANR